jgi:putative Mg2+ transporter-C (MgtC) family protein
MIGISTLQFAIRLLLAIAMGATVGLERQWRQRMAGTRTNALVAAGAGAFVMCGLLLDNDPSARGRIVSYVVSGVGFLGAGVIFKDGASVRGLNTAATIWCSAAIGALSGLGSFHLALVLAFAVLFTNMILRPLAYRLHPVLPEAIPAETLYELKLDCKVYFGSSMSDFGDFAPTGERVPLLQISESRLGHFASIRRLPN